MSQIRFEGSGACRLSPKAPLVVVYYVKYSIPSFDAVELSWSERDIDCADEQAV